VTATTGNLALCTFALKPHALHLVEVLHGGDPLPGELAAHGLRLLDLVSPQHVLGTLAVDVAVSRVHGLSLVQPADSFVGITSVLVNLALVKKSQM
jgi:hypothetical protein